MNDIRARIDEVDNKILELFCERMELVAKVAEHKQALGMDVFDPMREAGKLRAAAAVGGDSYGDYTRKMMEHLMSLSRDYQEQLRWSTQRQPPQK